MNLSNIENLKKIYSEEFCFDHIELEKSFDEFSGKYKDVILNIYCQNLHGIWHIDLHISDEITLSLEYRNDKEKFQEKFLRFMQKHGCRVCAFHIGYKDNQYYICVSICLSNSVNNNYPESHLNYRPASYPFY
jgi:hypothetical protein